MQAPGLSILFSFCVGECSGVGCGCGVCGCVGVVCGSVSVSGFSFGCSCCCCCFGRDDDDGGVGRTAVAFLMLLSSRGPLLEPFHVLLSSCDQLLLVPLRDPLVPLVVLPLDDSLLLDFEVLLDLLIDVDDVDDDDDELCQAGTILS